MIDGWIPFINLTIGLSFVDPINKYGYADSFLYQFDTRQDCSMLTVPKLLVVDLSAQVCPSKNIIGRSAMPLFSIINQLCSDWAQLMQITGPVTSTILGRSVCIQLTDQLAMTSFKM